jgi:hypothetical protein
LITLILFAGVQIMQLRHFPVISSQVSNVFSAVDPALVELELSSKWFPTATLHSYSSLKFELFLKKLMRHETKID